MKMRIWTWVGLFLSLLLACIHADKITFSSELVQAAANEDFDKVKAMIEEGADVNQQSRGVTVLHFAITKNRLDMVKYLVEKGANVNYPNPTGEVPVQIAILNGVHDIVDYLLRVDAVDIFAKNPFNYNIMHVAAQKGDANAARILTERGFNKWNDINEYMDTPLHVALKYNNFEVAWLLVKNPDVDVELQNDAGWGAFLLACCAGDVGVVRYLKDHRGADDKMTNSDQETCLHRAVQHGHLEISKYLIEELGHDVDSRDFAEWTPLHFSVLLGQLELFDYLIEKGADPLATTQDGITLPVINEKTKSTKEPVKQMFRKRLVKYFSELAQFFPDIIEGESPTNTNEEPEVIIEEIVNDNIEEIIEISSPKKDEL